ncbi:hypothetical protein EMCRGX_G016575 [Ephydatia muelleri]
MERGTVTVSAATTGGMLYHQVPAGNGSEGERVEQLVLPRQCHKTVLTMAHSIPLAGNLGRRKTADPMDIVGPLPRSSRGNRYVLVVCDYAARYPEAMAMRSVEAERVAEELVTLFSRVGVPKEILTDQGTNLTSQLLQELYRMLHVRHIRASPYHPQTDGLVERFNQTLKTMLRKTAVDEGKDWDWLLPGSVEPEPLNVATVNRFETPKTKTQVRAFLGITGYYRRFIPNYAAMVLPLTELTKNPDFDKPFILQTDASEYGVGAVLSKHDQHGRDHPVAYFSRKLLPREVRYSTVEKECLAIKLGMETF